MKYIKEFDGLRGILSTMVVVAHLHPSFVYWVWGSMDIFFCMSGFLIGSLLLNGQGKPGFYRNYALRRIFRIWPTYFVVVIGCIAIWMLFRSVSGDPPKWAPGLGTLQYFFFVQNVEIFITGNGVDSAGYIDFLGHGWSVALEEQFYVLIPFICWLLAKSSSPRLFAALLAVVGMAAGLYGRNFIEDALWALPFRADGFLSGLLLASLLKYGGELSSRHIKNVAWPVFIISSAVLVCLYAQSESIDFRQASQPLYSFGVTAFSVLGAALLALIVCHQGQPVLALLRNRTWVFLGQMSYSTYLAHVPIIWYGGIIFEHADWMTETLRFWIELPLCFLAAYGLHISIERPMLTYRHRVRSNPETQLVSNPL